VWIEATALAVVYLSTIPLLLSCPQQLNSKLEYQSRFLELRMVEEMFFKEEHNDEKSSNFHLGSGSQPSAQKVIYSSVGRVESVPDQESSIEELESYEKVNNTPDKAHELATGGNTITLSEANPVEKQAADYGVAPKTRIERAWSRMARGWRERNDMLEAMQKTIASAFQQSLLFGIVLYLVVVAYSVVILTALHLTIAPHTTFVVLLFTGFLFLTNWLVFRAPPGKDVRKENRQLFQETQRTVLLPAREMCQVLATFAGLFANTFTFAPQKDVLAEVGQIPILASWPWNAIFSSLHAIGWLSLIAIFFGQLFILVFIVQPIRARLRHELAKKLSGPQGSEVDSTLSSLPPALAIAAPAEAQA
jgi:hypothetical protein